MGYNIVMNYNSLPPITRAMLKSNSMSKGILTTEGEIPNIAIINASDTNASAVIEMISGGVISAGGVPNVFAIPPFGLRSRMNPLAGIYENDFTSATMKMVAGVLKSNLIDGAVLVTDCEVIALGAILGASQINCPIIVVPTHFTRGNFVDVPFFMGKHHAGHMKMHKDFDGFAKYSTLNHGQGGFKFGSTSNTFFAGLELMGFVVANGSIIEFGSGAHLDMARRTAQTIIDSAKSGLAPKRFITRDSVTNAVAALLSIDGSVAGMNKISKLLSHCGGKMSHDFINGIAVKTPLLGQIWWDIYNQGGLVSIVKWLDENTKLIDDNAMTINGGKLRDELRAVETPKIESLAGASKMVYIGGNIAEDGAYVHVGADTPMNFSGRAWVYNGVEDAAQAILGGAVEDGVIVLRKCTNTDVTSIVEMISGMTGRSEDNNEVEKSKFAIVTDGYADDIRGVLVVQMVSSNGYANENFANIQTGDAIEIDLAKSKLSTAVLAKDMKARAKKNSTSAPAVHF